MQDFLNPRSRSTVAYVSPHSPTPKALPKQEKSEKEEGVNRILLTEKTPPRSDFL